MKHDKNQFRFLNFYKKDDNEKLELVMCIHIDDVFIEEDQRHWGNLKNDKAKVQKTPELLPVNLTEETVIEVA